MGSRVVCIWCCLWCDVDVVCGVMDSCSLMFQSMQSSIMEANHAWPPYRYSTTGMYLLLPYYLLSFFMYKQSYENGDRRVLCIYCRLKKARPVLSFFVWRDTVQNYGTDWSRHNSTNTNSSNSTHPSANSCCNYSSDNKLIARSATNS
jgi:hypothetical protein